MNQYNTMTTMNTLAHLILIVKKQSPLQWILLGLVLAGVALSSPSFYSWGLIVVTLLGSFVYWLIEAISWKQARIRLIPTHWLWILLGLIAAGHMLIDQYDAYLGISGGSILKGSVNNSFWFQMGIIWLGIMLFQQAFTKRLGVSFFQDFPLLLLAIGALLVALLTETDIEKTVAWFIGLGATVLWLSPAGTGPGLSGLRVRPIWPPIPEHVRVLWLSRLILSVFPVGLLFITAGINDLPLALILILLAVFFWRIKKCQCSGAWSLLAICILMGGIMALWFFFLRPDMPPSLLGWGERGLLYSWGGDWGVNFLSAFTGNLGLLAGILAPFFIIPLINNNDRPFWWAPILFLAIAAGMLAWLSPGGLVSPLVTVGLIVLWGRLGPEINTQKIKTSIGGWLLISLLIAAIAMLVITANPGLVTRLKVFHEMSDKSLHRILGFLLTLSLGWWGSTRRWYWGLVGLFLGVIAGLAVEYIQFFVTEVLKSSGRRSMEQADFWAHCIGAGAAIGCWGLGQFGHWARVHKYRNILDCIHVLLIIAVTIFAVLWGVTLFEAYRQTIIPPTPWICASDMVTTELPKFRNGKPRTLYLPGATNNEEAAQNVLTITVSPKLNEIATGWRTISLIKKEKKLRILPSVRQTPEELDVRKFVGLPYSPLAYVQGTPIRILRIKQSEPLWLIDVRDILGLPKKDLQKYKEKLELLKREGHLVFVFPKWADKLFIHKQKLYQEFPHIPIVCASAQSPSITGVVRSLKLSLAQPKASFPPIKAISSDPAFRKTFKNAFPKQFLQFINIDTAAKWASTPRKPRQL